MRFDSLEAWLAWQETLNPRDIELGLDRIRRVRQRLLPSKLPFRVITVGGTNGKGSVSTFAAAILQAGGIKVGRYLSPHLLRYNERIAVNGVNARDAELCDVFEAVDQARHNESLTYFEFGTLAALEFFRRKEVEVAVLEVGLGGRLDAVNVIDADVAVVVSIGLDHVEWLGSEIGQIAREKAGIFRRDQTALFGSADPPPALLSEAQRIGARLRCIGKEFEFRQLNTGNWNWITPSRCIENLPRPMPGMHQYANAATALAAVLALHPALPDEAARAGMADAALPGRLQILPGKPEFVLDVGHNADAATRIADFLRENPRPTTVVLGMLADKDTASFVRALAPVVDGWYFAGLAGPRGQSAEALAEKFRSTGVTSPWSCYPDVAAAVAFARRQTPPEGRVLVTGSFHTVEAFLVYSGQTGGNG